MSRLQANCVNGLRLARTPAPLVCHFAVKGRLPGPGLRAAARRRGRAVMAPGLAPYRLIPIRANSEPVHARARAGAERARAAPLHEQLVLGGAERAGTIGIGLTHERATLRLAELAAAREMIDVRFRVDPDNRAAAAVRPGVALRRELVGVHRLPRRYSRLARRRHRVVEAGPGIGAVNRPLRCSAALSARTRMPV